MVAAARERLGPDADIRRADLLELERELEEPVDAILSTATFHWVADHAALFRSLHGALRPGGQAGGAVRGRGQHHHAARPRGRCHGARALRRAVPRLSAAVELRQPRRHARATAGGRVRHRPSAGSAPAPTEPEHPREFLSTIVLGPHVQHLPESLREPFMDEVLAELGEPVVVDYVRLNIDATA